MRGLAGKAILVAGGGGIGAATARRLSEEGARVALGDIDFGQAQADAAGRSLRLPMIRPTKRRSSIS